MTYEELTAKRHQLQIQIAGIDKQLILLVGDPARQILSFLNEKTGKKYRPVAANLRMIRARLKEGCSVEELRQVVAMKCREWRNNNRMQPYLRPATLFNATKCAQYIGELK